MPASRRLVCLGLFVSALAGCGGGSDGGSGGSVPAPLAVAITAPAGGATVAGVATVLVTATAAPGIASVALKVDGATHTSTQTGYQQYGFVWNTTGLTNGAHTLVACALDRAGSTECSPAVNVAVNNVGGNYWRTVQPPVGGNSLYAVWGSSATDVWAVGSGGTILHWNGSAWSSVPGGSGYSMYSIYGFGPADVWIAAAHTMLHWNGSSWTSVKPGNTTDLVAVWGSKSSDVWAVGQDEIHHWNGSAWTKFTNPIPMATYGSIWGSGPNDVWAIGYDFYGTPRHGVAIHWNGSTWSRVGLPSDTSEWLAGLWGSSTTSVWAFEYRSGGGNALRWNGSTWSAGSYGSPAMVSASWGANSSDLWAVGHDENRRADHSLVLHWNGAAWSPVPSGTLSGLYGIWGAGPSSIWAVGSGGISYFGP